MPDSKPVGFTYICIRQAILMATTYTVTGPTSGGIGETQTYSVALGSGTLAAPVTVVVNSNGGPGNAMPTQLQLTNESRIATFTYTRQSAGQTLLSFTNSGTLTDPASIVYTASAAAVERYNVTGPSSGAAGQVQTFVVSLSNGMLAAPVTISISSDYGNTLPASVQLTDVIRSAQFQYSRDIAGQTSLSFTNSGALADPGPLLFSAVAASSIGLEPVLPNAEGVCGVAVPGVLNSATVQDFIVAYTLVETTELSNLDSGGSNIDCERLNKALRDAYAELSSRKLMLTEQAGKVIDMNLNRWMLVIARYLLDSIRRRPDVTADYEKVMSQLDGLSELASDVSGGAFKVYNHNGKTAVYTQDTLRNFTSRTHGVL